MDFCAKKEKTPWLSNMAGTLIYLKDSCSTQFDYQRELALNSRSSSCELFLELNGVRAHIQPCKDRKNNKIWW